MAWDPGSLPSPPSPPFYKETASGLAPPPRSSCSHTPDPTQPSCLFTHYGSQRRNKQENNHLLLPSGPVLGAFTEGARRLGRPRRKGRTENTSQRGDQRGNREGQWAGVQPHLPPAALFHMGFTSANLLLKSRTILATPLQDVVAQFLHYHHSYPLVPCIFSATPSTLFSGQTPSVPIIGIRPSTTLSHPHHTLVPRPQHLVDGCVHHHPSDDLCLVGHLWLLLQGLRNC